MFALLCCMYAVVYLNTSIRFDFSQTIQTAPELRKPVYCGIAYKTIPYDQVITIVRIHMLLFELVVNSNPCPSFLHV